MGIDVSKGYADFMIINSKKQPVAQSFQLDDTFEGHRMLYNTLGAFLAKHDDATLFAGMESTGGYEKHKKQGKHSRAAMGICMHKILRILYGMLKHNQPFNPHVDLANRLRSVPMQNDNAVDKTSRRLQSYDQSAPVSRRQRKKRLERERSHNVNDTKSGITAPAPLADIIVEMLPQL